MRFALLAIAFGLPLGACTTTDSGVTGTTSLEITIVTPTNVGDANTRLTQTSITATINIQAKDALGKNDATYNHTVGVYAHYLGTLSPYLDGVPITRINLVNGVAMNQTVVLPPTFGPTTIWADDSMDPNPTYATGVSSTLWFRDPFISDIQNPIGFTGNDVYDFGPLDHKNIAVNSSRYGAAGKLVVTSVFAQGYTVADVNCPSGAAPCTSQAYDYLEVFSFSAPTDQNRLFISEGQTISGFAGGITQFDGLTEIGFPQTFVGATSVVDKSLEPAVSQFDQTWFTTNKIHFEENEANAIEIDGAVVCPLDANYTTYKQWKLDPSGVGSTAVCGGKNLINVISAGVVDLDPGTLVGKVVPKIVGVLRPVNIGSFNVWIIYPRSAADITTN
ncbi:hypothetical protein BH11MYX1_BH11MYX1_29190 [soil metagenome]